MPLPEESVPEHALHIDSLVLHGFQAIDRHVLAAALERELARLLGSTGAASHLTAGGGPKDGLHLYRLDAGSIAVPHDASAAAVGVEVAKALYQGLAGGHAGSDAPQRAPSGARPR